MSVLEVKDIEVFYDEFQALFGVSIDVVEGEIVAIIGANGAGKTTLLRAIAGVIAPTRGTINFRGTTIVGSPAYELNRMGIAMVPEGRLIFPSLTVEENLKVGGYADRNGRWNLDEIYTLFPSLKGLRKIGGTDLSGGQQQMVAIGRALMSNPDLILMDEISLGLAPIIIRELYQVVRQISEAGTTVILVEQDVARGLAEADRFYCLLEGKVSLAGRAGEIEQTRVAKAYFGI